jgi:hypothetical protein
MKSFLGVFELLYKSQLQSIQSTRTITTFNSILHFCSGSKQRYLFKFQTNHPSLSYFFTMRFIYVASLLFATVAVANPLSSLQERNVLVLRQFGCVRPERLPNPTPDVYTDAKCRTAMRMAARDHPAALTVAALVYVEPNSVPYLAY